MGHILSYTEDTEKQRASRKGCGPVVKMAALAPKGVFEEEEIRVYSFEEEPHERHFDYWDRNWEDAA